MTIRILHTADNHIGLPYRNYPEDVRKVLIEERLGALERLVETANSKQVHLFVVAGDLFDRLTVAADVVRRTIDLLKGFHGEAVLLLPGNHDYCEGPESKLWTKIRKAASGSNVMPLTSPDVHEFSIHDQRIQVFACPCPSKTATEPANTWVRGAPKAQDALRLGLAHGNVEGLGLDAEGKYFTMRESELALAGVDTWLLGHVHVPSPESGTVGQPTFFMPGTHTPDSVNCGHPGHAFLLEFDDTGRCSYESLSTGRIRFVRFTRALEHDSDVEKLGLECDELTPPSTVLDLQLSGRLTEQALGSLQKLLGRLAQSFLHFERELEIETVLDREKIARSFPDGTLPAKLLTALLEDEHHPGDAHLAFDVIEGLHKQ